MTVKTEILAGLNPMQREAVLATEGPVLILAGAGSGKTTVLIHRIAHLLQLGAVPWRILAITFTNKAADELKSRLENMLGEEARDIWACTFHSACVRILRKEAELLGYGANFTIYDTSDSQSLMKRILKDLNLDEKAYPPRSVLAEISRAKDLGILPAEFAADADKSFDSRRKTVARLYTEYHRRLFSANAMDFDDLILNTVTVLQREADRRAYWQTRFSHILVDEYQDTNHMQYLLVSLLAEQHKNLCVVGDDDQSIYRFRGATIENILSFEKQYPGCKVIRLEQNYRSTEKILRAANAVIQNNRGRKGKTLWTSREGGDPVRLYSAGTGEEEAYYISSAILTNYSHGLSWSDHAVLYRMNAQSGQIEFALKRAGIPYRIVGGARFFDRAEVKDVLSYLCVIADPKDDLRLSRIVNVPPRGIGEKSIETARALAWERKVSLFEILEQAEEFPELHRSALKMREFAGLIRDLQQYREDIALLFDQVVEKTGYLKMLENAKEERDQNRADNVRELKTSILQYIRESGDASLDGYLASIALYTDLDSLDRDADAVVLMTIHSAKGLEFPVVYVIGMEEGLFPGLRAIGEEEEMEEERRLCYVAFTRAKDHLILTHARERMLYGKTTANRPSRFLQEGVPELLQNNIRPRQSASSQRMVPQRAEPPKKSSFPSLSSPAPLPQLQVGQRIIHKAYGEGTVTAMNPMGNDCLLEIDFVRVGKKKMMLRSVAKFIQIA